MKKTLIAALCAVSVLGAAAPALAQFYPGGGYHYGGPYWRGGWGRPWGGGPRGYWAPRPRYWGGGPGAYYAPPYYYPRPRYYMPPPPVVYGPPFGYPAPGWSISLGW